MCVRERERERERERKKKVIATTHNNDARTIDRNNF